MGFNLRNEEANRLADELAALTKETKTKAITEAVRERLLRVKRRKSREAVFAEMMEIGRRCAARIKSRPVPHGEFLYDERGLPK